MHLLCATVGRGDGEQLETDRTVDHQVDGFQCRFPDKPRVGCRRHDCLIVPRLIGQVVYHGHVSISTVRDSVSGEELDVTESVWRIDDGSWTEPSVTCMSKGQRIELCIAQVENEGRPGLLKDRVVWVAYLAPLDFWEPLRNACWANRAAVIHGADPPLGRWDQPADRFDCLIDRGDTSDECGIRLQCRSDALDQIPPDLADGDDWFGDASGEACNKRKVPGHPQLGHCPEAARQYDCSHGDVCQFVEALHQMGSRQFLSYECVGTGPIVEHRWGGHAEHTAASIVRSPRYRFHKSAVSTGYHSETGFCEQAPASHARFVESVPRNRLGGAKDGNDLVGHVDGA